MRIAVGSDEDHPTARAVLAWLHQQGLDVQVVGILDGPALSWPARVFPYAAGLLGVGKNAPGWSS